MTIPEKGCILLYIYGYLIFNLEYISMSAYAADDFGAARNAKAFSLFSVVTFKNDECTSDSTFTGGAVKGTCYSATECSDKKGTSSGNCASGFGVCCCFISNTGTAAVSENRTYLQSLLYPAIETSTTAITYTINKMQEDICQVRLDFDNFAIAGPTVSDETLASTTAWSNCADTLITTLGGSAMVPTLCGTMTGSHLYLDLGMASTDTAKLALTFQATLPTAANAMRSWRIKTAQIPCWAPYRAPDGCLQYFYGDPYGQLWSPNFRTGPSTTQSGPLKPAGTADAASEAPNYAMDLMGQDMKYCIRREKNMCCTLFQVCNYDPDGKALVEAIAGGDAAQGTAAEIDPGWSFHIDCYAITGSGTAAVNNDLGFVDEDCTADYVEIPDSSNFPNYGTSSQVNTRYCCQRLGNVPGATIVGALSHSPIYDCTEPWEVTYHTDIYTDEVTVATDSTDRGVVIARGMCLLFKQLAC